VGPSHLSYCTNIHPGESWPEVRAALQRHAPEVRQRVCPDAPFGLGLRLSALAARQLQEPAALAEFRAFLADRQLYVYTINGFPHGRFHGARVKESVYLPDWTDPERLDYSNRLADLLQQLLPEDPSLVGSVSTVPGAFKPNAVTPAARASIVEHLLQHAAHLAKLSAHGGRTIVLALEPEPCCMLETTAETVAFFERELWAPEALQRWRTLCGLAGDEAEAALRRHVGVCVDLCHAGVEFEDPAECVDALRRAGVAIAKLQVTAGLQVRPVDAAARAALERFADPVYLHQVVVRDCNGLRRHADLDAAFAAAGADASDAEWRVHFHVPLFLEQLGAFGSTQAFVREVLAAHRQQPVTQHLEVETYTWDVLPEAYRDRPVADAIAAELDWVRRQLQ
jgi:sugar phosphate isomerase/epimerase